MDAYATGKLNFMAHSLLNYNTFGIEADCSELFEYSSVAQLKEVLPHVGSRRRLHIGAGSNLLFVHPHFHGVVFHSLIKGKEVLAETADELLLRVGAGETWDDFVDYCVSHGYHGLENLSFIPGEVGASAVQNVGAYGVEAGDCIERVETVEMATGKERIFHHEDCKYAYRSSIFKHDAAHRFAVTHVVYRLKKHFSPILTHAAVSASLKAQGLSPETVSARQVRDAIIEIRKQKLPDPSEIGSAGSFFMNPVVDVDVFERLHAEYPDMPHYPSPSGGVKIPAAWLIEQCGWKGRVEGRAGVHERQALVLINVDHATGQDILQLAEHIRADVRQKFGVEIHPEVLYV